MKIRVSRTRLDDGSWHSFHTERTKQYGKVTVDGHGNDFVVPGTKILQRTLNNKPIWLISRDQTLLPKHID